jgi:hypothetical protein
VNELTEMQRRARIAARKPQGKTTARTTFDDDFDPFKYTQLLKKATA